MEPYLFLLCKYKSETVLLKVGNEYQFSDLVSELCNNWHNLSVGNVSVCYSIPGHSRILLRNQIEFGLMLCLASELGLKTIEIDVDVYGGGSMSSGGSDFGNTLTVSGFVDNSQSMVVDDAVVNLTVPSTSLDGDAICSQPSTSRERVRLSSSWARAIKSVGQIFEGGAKEFRNALCCFAVEVGFKFVYERNTDKLVVAFCASKFSDDCKWYIVASVSKVNDFFYIRKFLNEHSCGILLSNGDSKMLSYKRMADFIFDQVRSNPAFTAIEVMNFFRANYGLNVQYKKAWKCLEMAKSLIFGDQGDSYKCLRWYVETALRTNVGSHIVLDVIPSSSRFRRLFISLNASILGFQFCRPMLFLDGTFCKGLYKGIILSATAKDGNQGNY